VTTSVTAEWLYIGLKQHTLEYVTDVSELLAASFCYLFIIIQFFEFHFKPHSSPDIPEQQQITVIGIKPIADRF